MSVKRMDGGVEKESRFAFYLNPSVKPSVCQLPVKGSLMGNGFHCMRQPRSSTQKFIVEAASEKKARHLACFDDSDASDDSVQGG